LAKLRKFKNIHYTLGQHKLEDFRNRDFILKAAGVPLDSPYIAEARKNGIPIEMDASLFAKLAPEGITFIGITGTRGKTTTTFLIYEILKRAYGAERVYIGGNVKDTATLPLLYKVKKGDYVVLELDSWQLQGFAEAKTSPHIAVFTTFYDDHLNYYKGDREQYFSDKAAIFANQKTGDYLIAGKQVAEIIKNKKMATPEKFIVTKANDVPKGLKPKILGRHNLENIACALKVAEILKVDQSIAKKVINKFEAIPGRLQFIKNVNGVDVYNDTNATTPDATIAALRALGKNKNIILIMGGTDKVMGRHNTLVDEIPKYCKVVVLLQEKGSEKIKLKLEARAKDILQIKEVDGLQSCVMEAIKLAQKGDIILFSPAFASFGKWFKNEYDRGEQFLKIVESL